MVKIVLRTENGYTIGGLLLVDTVGDSNDPILIFKTPITNNKIPQANDGELQKAIIYFANKLNEKFEIPDSCNNVIGTETSIYFSMYKAYISEIAIDTSNSN